MADNSRRHNAHQQTPQNRIAHASAPSVAAADVTLPKSTRLVKVQRTGQQKMREAEEEGLWNERATRPEREGEGTRRGETGGRAEMEHNQRRRGRYQQLEVPRTQRFGDKNHPAPSQH